MIHREMGGGRRESKVESRKSGVGSREKQKIHDPWENGTSVEILTNSPKIFSKRRGREKRRAPQGVATLRPLRLCV